MDKNIEIMAALRAKVLQLVDLYESEKKKTSRLTVEINDLRKQLRNSEMETGALKDENYKLKFAVAFKSPGGAQNAKKMIDELVQEIDECMALLNR
ncbi:MAG: hypothetical protein LBD59_04735 [Prevotellaceae bacterium]|jgi:uncharacterized coiled-coil DUF342 family protein|nr:hypothetical protein [Prevotellaceae bacterium]